MSKENKDILVIYHKADWDGIFSREICRKFLGDDAEYLGWDYGDPVPHVEDMTNIVMVDISVEALMGHKCLVWIDHHKSAIEKYYPGIPGVRIDGVAACRLAYQFYFSHGAFPTKEAFVSRMVDEPYAVRLAGEYDVWDKRDPFADVFQHALRSEKLTPSVWHNLLGNPNASRAEVYRLIPAGQAIAYAGKEANAVFAKDCCFAITWEGLRFLVMNKPRASSMAFDSVVDHTHDALMTFYWAGTKWRVSMYHSPHRKDLDLSIIAGAHGGGGHRGACGFECATLPFALENQWGRVSTPG